MEGHLDLGCGQWFAVPYISNALNVTKLVSEGTRILTQLYDSEVHPRSILHAPSDRDESYSFIFCLAHEDPDQEIIFEHGTFKRI